MINIFRHSKLFIFMALAVAAAALLVSCSPASDEPGPEKSDDGASPAAVSPDTPSPTRTLTPVEELGITGVAQDVDIAQYRLTVTGLVEKTLSLTYQDILAYAAVTEIVTLNCPGYFVDVAEWTGVPLATLLAEAGVNPGATELVFSSVDGYRQTLSLEHINRHGVFLAYEVNGQTLPPEHGYPLRIVDRGSAGHAWVKWLEAIEVK